MIIRVFLFIATVFFLVMLVVEKLKLPVDAFLVLLFTFTAIILGLFAHYRYVGRLRTQDKISKALLHFAVWKPLLPTEAYLQLQTQFIVESGNEKTGMEAIERAERQGLSKPFVAGLLADLQRRHKKVLRAEKTLLAAIEDEPPGLHRSGLLSQLVRLYAVELPSPKNLEKCEALLQEASDFLQQDVHQHLLQAIRGELQLAKKEYKQAIELLEESLKNLFLLTSDQGQTGFFATLKRWVALATHSEKDEHQYPLFAEFYLSLSRAYKADKQKEKAKQTLQSGLEICQQPYIKRLLEMERV